MANIIRLCHPTNLRFVVVFDEGKFIGQMGQFIQQMLDKMKSNASLTVKVRSDNDGIGEPIEATDGQVYSGCIGLIQRNESDAMLQMVNYPLPAVNLTQGIVMTDSTLQFVNSYDTTREIKTVQIDSMFDSFALVVWILCATFLVSCVCCILVHRLVQKAFYRLVKRK